MRHCRTCDKDVNPTIDLVTPPGADKTGLAGAVVPALVCPQCEGYLGAIDDAPAIVTNAEPTRTAKVIAMPIAKTQPSDATSFIAGMTSRLEAIEIELARHKELKQEARRLRSMLRAGCKTRS